MPRASIAFLLLAGTLTLAMPGASTQSAPAAAKQPSFEAATIKLPGPEGPQSLGFHGMPGGRVFLGGYVKMLVKYAFNLQDYQISGGPGWISSQWYGINAVPPEDSPSRNIKGDHWEPTAEQRLMLQSLLHDRFGFKFHFETKEGANYILTRGSKKLQLKPPKDTTADPGAVVVVKSHGIPGEGMFFDGEAWGINTTTDFLALQLSRYLRLPVQNQTGITGAYDFDLPPDDPDNHDLVIAVIDVVNRLGLKLKRGRGPIQTLVIDHIEQPSEN